MSDDLFQAPDTVTADQLVGEGKKFKTIDDLAKSKIHADKHIETIERELSELRGDLQTRLTVEAMLEKLQKPAVTPPVDLKNVEPSPRPEPGSPEINLAEEVQKLLQQERAKEQADANLKSVREELKKRFGADYNQKLETIATELNISKEFLTDMAKRTPAGFLKLIDSTAAPDKDRPIVPPQGKNLAFVDQSASVKNAAYYRQLRKEHPDQYFSKKVQIEMHEQAAKQGPAFYN